MFKLLRFAFFALFATALVWAAVVWRWQHTQRAVEARDVVVYLVALPLVVIAGAVMLRWAWRRAASAQSAPAAVVQPAANAAPPTAAASERLLAMQLLAHGVCAPGADDAAALLSLAIEPPPVVLDEELRDGDGLGVFTRRCASLDLSADDLPALADAPTLTRSLVLGRRAAEPVLQAMREAAGEEADAPGDNLQAARPTLRVLWAWPEEAMTQQAESVQRYGGPCVRQWSAALPQFDWQFELLPARNGEALLLQAERRLLLAHRHQHDERVLLIAAHSLLDERLAERLDMQAKLMTAQRPAGVMLGEAGVALLLAPPQNGKPGEGAADGGVQLHRLSPQRRDKSIDEPGKVSAAVWVEAARQALDVAQCAADQIKRVVADTDMQRTRTSELLEAMQAIVPNLSAVEECHRVGAVTGACGLAAAPLTLALAAAHVQQSREPVLAMTHADPHDRLAALLTPRPEPPAA